MGNQTHKPNSNEWDWCYLKDKQHNVLLKQVISPIYFGYHLKANPSASISSSETTSLFTVCFLISSLNSSDVISPFHNLQRTPLDEMFLVVYQH